MCAALEITVSGREPVPLGTSCTLCVSIRALCIAALSESRIRDSSVLPRGDSLEYRLLKTLIPLVASSASPTAFRPPVIVDWRASSNCASTSLPACELMFLMAVAN